MAQLEMRHLEMLIAIADAATVTHAADRLGITQSALSHRIREAERRLDTALFKKVGRRLHMTPAGERLHAAALRAVDEVARAEDEVRALSDHVRHLVRLGQGTYSRFHWLPDFLGAFFAEAPDVEVDLVARATHYPFSALGEGAVDVVMVLGERHSEPRFRWHKLTPDPLVAISQTMNILKPKQSLMRVYPIFHFIPGDPKSKTAHRKDGGMHWLNTTPNSKNANVLLDVALATADFHRIGIAAHGFVDTWAHQNFIGYYADFNGLANPLATVLPNIGHADAQHNPDWPALVWRDQRLLEERIDNKARFLEAAGALLAKLARFANPKITDAEVSKRQGKLTSDLNTAIGERDQKNERANVRIKRYQKLATSKAYGGKALKKYDDDLWFNKAIREDVRGLRDRSDSSLTRWDPLTDAYHWKNPATFQQTDWYKFQAAVKTHQNDAWGILEKSNLKGLELAAL